MSRIETPTYSSVRTTDVGLTGHPLFQKNLNKEITLHGFGGEQFRCILLPSPNVDRLKLRVKNAGSTHEVWLDLNAKSKGSISIESISGYDGDTIYLHDISPEDLESRVVVIQSHISSAIADAINNEKVTEATDTFAVELNPEFSKYVGKTLNFIDFSGRKYKFKLSSTEPRNSNIFLEVPMRGAKPLEVKMLMTSMSGWLEAIAKIENDSGTELFVNHELPSVQLSIKKLMENLKAEAFNSMLGEQNPGERA